MGHDMDFSHPAIWFILGAVILIGLVMTIPDDEKKARERETHEFFRRENERHRQSSDDKTSSDGNTKPSV